jgi:hypothetical protein
MSVPTQFILRGLASEEPVVAGVYPMPTIDWNKVKTAAEAGVSDPVLLQTRGYTFNLKPETAQHIGNGYARVPEAKLGAVILKKEALSCMDAQPPTSDDENLCRAWGKDIVVDMDNQCTNFGPVEFAGCVGLRNILR